jgi:hypothetical protein
MSTFTKLFVVYDADGTLIGEISYILGHALGLRECSACDITHSLSQIGQGTGGEKPAWTAFKNSLTIPVVQLHRNDLDSSEKWIALKNQLPLIVGECENGLLKVVCSSEQLKICQGKVEKLKVLIESALEENLPPVKCAMRKRTTTVKGDKISKNNSKERKKLATNNHGHTHKIKLVLCCCFCSFLLWWFYL